MLAVSKKVGEGGEQRRREENVRESRESDLWSTETREGTRIATPGDLCICIHSVVPLYSFQRHTERLQSPRRRPDSRLVTRDV